MEFTFLVFAETYLELALQSIPKKPARNGGKFRDIFNDDSVYCFLIALDFRMKNVRAFGSRRLWELRLLDSWRAMDSLAAFYKMIMRSKTRVLRKNTAYEAFYGAEI